MSISREAAQELLDQLETARDVVDKVTDNFDALVQDASSTLVLPAEYDRRTLLMIRDTLSRVPEACSTGAEERLVARHMNDDHYLTLLRRLLTYLADNA